MPFWKKLLAAILILLAIVAIPPFMMGVAGFDVPDGYVEILAVVLVAYVLGAVIYLAVDLAMRQNRR